MGFILDATGIAVGWLSALVGIKLNDPHGVPFAGPLLTGAALVLIGSFVVNLVLEWLHPNSSRSRSGAD